MRVHPIRVAINQANDARRLIATGHTKRARRNLRLARRKVADCDSRKLITAYRRLGEAVNRLKSLEWDLAQEKAGEAARWLRSYTVDPTG